MLLCGVLTLLFVFCSCSNRHDLTDNYSVFTYGDGLYGESERDYPIFVSKLGYKICKLYIKDTLLSKESCPILMMPY